MSFTQYDVVVVGAGYAGLTAALGLARAGFTVAVVETAKELGGAGLLGGLCFAESLFQPDILGAESALTLTWERRLIEHGSFATDGRRLVGSTYRDVDAFAAVYTILRSRFSLHLAETACAYGVALHTETTVESLIREGRRILGVATTRGPFYAPLVFLAEGDAGLLVSREGFDRPSHPRDQPTFLYCLQQVLELPVGAVEERFDVLPGQGVAYDFLLRNPAAMPLNARGFLYTNRHGLTLSVVLPAANLQRYFTGEPRQLLDWFVEMPVLRPWLREGRPGAWTAALLRTGGLRDVPYLVEDGLVIGGAATGLGSAFPILNFLGPAAATGMLLSRAAARIRAEGRRFDRDALAYHYLRPLQQTRSWRDMEFVQRWPGYLERAHVLFGHGLDLLLDSASIWTRAKRWLPWKLGAWLRVLACVSWRRWIELRDEFFLLGRVLRLREAMPRPALEKLLLDGSLNAFRDLARQPRPHLPSHGTLRFHYHAADAEGRAGAVPWLFRRWFERFRPVLAAAARIFHANDDNPLSAKWTCIFELLLRQINLLDCLAVAGLAFLITLASLALAMGKRLFRPMRQHPTKQSYSCPEQSWRTEAAAANVPGLYTVSPPPLIRIAWRATQPEQQAASIRDLPHICPARVFEVAAMPPETVQVTVHAERCIACQACWRINPLVDWGRNGVSSLLLPSRTTMAVAPQGELALLFEEIDRKLWEFDVALAEGPALVSRPHNDYLETLARYAQQLANRICDVLHSGSEGVGKLQQPVLELANALAACTAERTRRTWEGRFAWASAEGRLLRQHHLAELRRLLALPAPVEAMPRSKSILRSDWLSIVSGSHHADATIKHLLADLAARHYLLETLESIGPTAEAVRDGLSVALVRDLRNDLLVRTRELRALLSDNPAPIHLRHVPSVAQAYGRYGRRLFEDGEETRKLLDVPGAWSKMAQLHVLQAEREELAESERRLLALPGTFTRPTHQETADEVSVGFGRQMAHILASKRLLLQTFARLENGDDAELAILLLRVWLDHTAALLDEYAIVVREHLHPVSRPDDRPLIEPDCGAPLRTQAEYLAAPATYRSGDFLLVPVDLLQPRLTPEMVGEKEMIIANAEAAALLWLLRDIKYRYNRPHSPYDLLYSTEASAVETIGRYAADPSVVLNLEWACSRLLLIDSYYAVGALRERCIILRALAEVVMPRLWHGGIEARARHLERDVLQLEAFKADFRQRLTAGWQTFGEALGRNADVQASCFALAEAAAWLKAADSTLGRMAWLSRLCQAEDREEPAAQQELARRTLAHCFAKVRDRLFRFDEDLAALRRGYYAPHVYAAALLGRRIL